MNHEKEVTPPTGSHNQRRANDVDADFTVMIDRDAYDEAEAMILDWLRNDCGRTGKLIAHRFRESDYGASQIVDALVVYNLDRDAIKVEVQR